MRRAAPDVAAPTPLRGAGPHDGPASRGRLVALVLFILVLVVAVGGSVVHLPYAVMSPGAAIDTLGDRVSRGARTPILTVAGAKTYPTDGALRFTTVSVSGGPGYPVDLWKVLGAWVDPAQDVLPVDEVFDPRATSQQVEEENAIEMKGSQQEATAVALRAAGYGVPTSIVVARVLDTSKAKGLLRAGDRLVRVGGVAATSAEAVRGALQRVRPGASVPVDVTRAGRPVTVTVQTIEGSGGRTALGVLLGLDHDFPVTVTVSAGDVGGPSAGLMFALGIFDKITAGSLTGNHDIAGTGTIDDTGAVGPIGGIKQKLVGARASGADYFLAPAANCAQVIGNVPAGIEVYKVASFADARAAVEGIAKGQTASLPRC
ncbi:MAG TPA: S16 family serine protease [Intrasporangium sp.]|uniref:YlbL family protein n=1 Tax=Intrasporangium sp. TaxID=1925024 RepID=UPI002D775021|nr:S16 family serine protease [Intrasporangium sp.]HET7399623.1 S16 family serine protease [Intrasporangium sp.]